MSQANIQAEAIDRMLGKLEQIADRIAYKLENEPMSMKEAQHGITAIAIVLDKIALLRNREGDGE